MEIRVLRNRTLWTLALALGFGVAQAGATEYSITDLGVLGRSTASGSNGYALNASGKVTGTTSADPNGMHAFRYDGTMTDLGTLGTGRQSYGFSINSLGEVAGSSDRNDPPTERRAFFYDGTLHEIGTLGGNVSEARGLNDSGVVVGYSTNASGIARAFLYDGTSLTDLGTLGGASAWASAINTAGAVVGQSVNTAGVIHAFFYDGTDMADLGTLDALATQELSSAVALNSAVPPQIVGNSMVGEHFHAFLHDGTTMTDLGALGADENAFAAAINDDGVVVGQSQSVTGDRAFICVAGVMTDLNLLTPGTGWRLTDASSINNSGQIVGTGNTPGGQVHAYLLTPLP